MNLVLLEADEVGRTLPRDDARVDHILKVLRRRVGDSFDAGLVNGALGKATVVAADETGVQISFVAAQKPPALPAITLIVGLPRPATARDILRDATTMGVSAIHFVETERTDPNYVTSKLWIDGEWRRYLLAGAAQAFDTRLPEVTWTKQLEEVLVGATGTWLALDNYEASTHLGSFPCGSAETPLTLAVGPERGWAAHDRAVLRAAGAQFVHLGARVLRVEMAVVAALAIWAAKQTGEEGALGSR